MPQTLFHNDFSQGWCPSDNYINGRKNGLLQMDNLCLDDNGALTSVRGPAPIGNPLSAIAHTIGSATISGTQKQYAALEDGSVVEDSNFATTLFTGGSTSRAAFGNVLDQILMCSGSQFKKWDGTTLRNLGIVAPNGAPTVVANTPSTLSVANLDGSQEYSNWTVDDGSLVSDNPLSYAVLPAANNLGQIHTTFSSPFNAAVLGNGAAMDPSDTFNLSVEFADGSNVLGVQITLYPDDGSGNPDIGNAFIFQWDTTNTNFPIGVGGSIVLQCLRSDFSPNGIPSPDKWGIIKEVRIYFWGNTNFTYDFGQMEFIGGAPTLTGNYNYLQVNVYSNGKYLVQSGVSAIANVNPALASVHITPYTTGIDPQVNQIWIFRQNTNSEQNYFQVKVVLAPFSAFDDIVQDTAAELLDITANLYLTALGALTSQILEIIGLWFGRVLYFDAQNCYFSDLLDPDQIDPRKTVRYSGNSSETFLWAVKVTNSVILVGTDLDIYEMSGTFDELPDGTLDLSFRALAVKNPPVSIARAVYSSSVIYQAADGWRLFDGINSTPLSQNFDALYKNITKYTYAPISDGYFSGQQFASAAVANKKLYTTQIDTNGTYKCLIYDLIRQYWYVYQDGLYSLGSREDGTILGGSINKQIYNLEFSLGNPTACRALFVVENSTPPANITVSGTSPRNRKDSYTFKCNINTNGYKIDIFIAPNRQYGNLIHIGQVTTGTLQQVIIDISISIGIVDSWQVGFSGNVDGLVLSDYSIDFDQRPTQLTHLKRLPDNLGNAGLKQLTVVPFVIDTLGNKVELTPTVDGVIYPSQFYNTTRKQTCFYYFKSETLVVDFGADLSGSLFEFYEWLQPEIVQVLQVNRLFDNTGPIEFTKNARFLALRFRLYPLGTSIQVSLIADEVIAYKTTLVVQPKMELVYEVIVPRGVNGTVFQIEHLSLDEQPFAKLSLEYKAVVTGGQTDNRWRKAE